MAILVIPHKFIIKGVQSEGFNFQKFDRFVRSAGEGLMLRRIR